MYARKILNNRPNLVGKTRYQTGFRPRIQNVNSLDFSETQLASRQTSESSSWRHRSVLSRNPPFSAEACKFMGKQGCVTKLTPSSLETRIFSSLFGYILTVVTIPRAHHTPVLAPHIRPVASRVRIPVPKPFFVRWSCSVFRYPSSGWNPLMLGV